MSVVAGSIGVHLKFAERLAENSGRVNANSESTANLNLPAKDFSRDLTEISSSLSPAVIQLLNQSIAINTSAFEGKDEHGEETFVGSKTETALLTFAKNQGWENFKSIRDSAPIIDAYPFSSERKAMATVIKTQKGYRVLIKGASEVLFKKSNRHIVVSEDPSGNTADVQTEEFDETSTNNVDRTIIFYANQSLRTIALCYRDYESWPPVEPVDGQVPYDALANDLTLVAITAIEDPLRPGVTEAVRTAQKAGVAVKMCTGDNVLTAKSIALQCGIYTPGGIIMEGLAFRNLSEQEQREIAPRLQVLARSSPNDKKMLVDALKSEDDTPDQEKERRARGQQPLRGNYEVVGVTGDGANDAPALKTVSFNQYCMYRKPVAEFSFRFSHRPTSVSQWVLPVLKSPRRHQTLFSWTTTLLPSSLPSLGDDVSTTLFASSFNSRSLSTLPPSSSPTSLPSLPSLRTLSLPPYNSSGST
jgi:Ca2+-transporting ATPase